MTALKPRRRKYVRWVAAAGLEISPEVESELRSLAARAEPNETGGLLLGWWEDSRPVIVGAVEVPDVQAGRACWTRTETVAHSVLWQARRTLSDPNIGYIGDWHSHPANVGF